MTKTETDRVFYDSGYQHCACRDCFDLAIGVPGAFCWACKEAGCPDYQGQEGMSQECQRDDAYSGSEDESAVEYSSRPLTEADKALAGRVNTHKFSPRYWSHRVCLICGQDQDHANHTGGQEVR